MHFYVQFNDGFIYKRDILNSFEMNFDSLISKHGPIVELLIIQDGGIYFD